MTRLWTTRKFDGLKAIIVTLLAAGFITWLVLR